MAQTAGVSVATVSRVINNVQSVDPKLSKRVWNAVSQLGYIPNTQARALVSGKSKLFGLIISDITNPFFPELIQGFEDKAVEVGYETLIGSTNYDLRKMELCVQRMLERKVEGVAVMTFGIEEPLLERLTSQRIPMVFVDVAAPDAPISAIKVDYRKGLFEAVQHLAVLGHRRIAFLRVHSDCIQRLRVSKRFSRRQKASGFASLLSTSSSEITLRRWAPSGPKRCCPSKNLRLPFCAPTT